MEPLLFADHLRRMRETARHRPQTKHPGLEIAGAVRVVGAACAACLLFVMLQAALSAPAVFQSGPQLAALAEEETGR